LELQFQEIGIQNMYSMFIVHAIRSLREGGILCFIVQDSFLTNVYYKNFRKFVLDNCLIHEITLAPRRLFHQRDADVRTAILILEKCTTTDKADVRAAHVMKLVDRLHDETEYDNPPAANIQHVPQRAFMEMDHHNFFINVPPRIIDVILTTGTKLGDVVQGGTGISTGHDARFLRKTGDVNHNAKGLQEQEDVGEYQATNGNLDDHNMEWVPFYKNGGCKDAWHYETPYQIKRDWQTPSQQHKDFLARNSSFYFREGITCSSMGIDFSAAYLPPGCLFGVNANFFCDSSQHLFYVLGFLNSLLAKYLIRAVYNRTNMVTAGYLKRLPYIEPDVFIKQAVSQLARSIVEKKQENPNYDFSLLQSEIDALIFQTYGISEQDEARVRKFCANMFESI
jgi:adenine-specific DNA-methyltransferase